MRHPCVRLSARTVSNDDVADDVVDQSGAAGVAARGEYPMRARSPAAPRKLSRRARPRPDGPSRGMPGGVGRPFTGRGQAPATAASVAIPNRCGAGPLRRHSTTGEFDVPPNYLPLNHRRIRRPPKLFADAACPFRALPLSTSYPQNIPRPNQSRLHICDIFLAPPKQSGRGTLLAPRFGLRRVETDAAVGLRGVPHPPQHLDSTLEGSRPTRRAALMGSRPPLSTSIPP
eukprot:1190547-Prorocentrum_minimum.AAC.2